MAGVTVSLAMARIFVDSNRMSELSVELAKMLETVEANGLVVLYGRKEVPSTPTMKSWKPLEHE